MTSKKIVRCVSDLYGQRTYTSVRAFLAGVTARCGGTPELTRSKDGKEYRDPKGRLVLVRE